jgi:hypothetical protein
MSQTDEKAVGGRTSGHIAPCASRPGMASKRCSWRNQANGPEVCSSTNRVGGSTAVMLLVRFHVRPRCRARHVTVSPWASSGGLRETRNTNVPVIRDGSWEQLLGGCARW